MNYKEKQLLAELIESQARVSRLEAALRTLAEQAGKLSSAVHPVGDNSGNAVLLFPERFTEIEVALAAAAAVLTEDQT